MKRHLQLTQKCNKCGVEKELATDFRNQSAARLGKKKVCKDCDSQTEAERYKEKKAQITKKVRSWQEKNTEKVREYKRKWKEKQKRGGT